MFATSTQCKYWIFNSEEELNKLRERATQRHVQNYGRHVNVSTFLKPMKIVMMKIFINFFRIL